MNSTYNFLLIDDSEFDLFVYGSIIKKSGISKSLNSFRSASDALEYLKEQDETFPATVILLDLQMSGMNGFEFMEKFRHLPAALKERIRLFMLSSTIDQGDISRVKADPDILDLLTKPLEVPPLLHLIEVHGNGIDW